MQNSYEVLTLVAVKCGEDTTTEMVVSIDTLWFRIQVLPDNQRPERP